VKYDTNDLEEEDENDGSDAKNNETFFESSITSGDAAIATSVGRKSGENNNNYNFNNKNGDMSDAECDLIQRALYMTLNDDASSQGPKEESSNHHKCKPLKKV